MIDFVQCGFVCFVLLQDVQIFVYDWFEVFFVLLLIWMCCLLVDVFEFVDVFDVLKVVKKLLIVVGGGVLYSQVWDVLCVFVDMYGVLVVELQVGKGSFVWDYLLNFGLIGVMGLFVVNCVVVQVDVVFVVGMWLQDFMIGLYVFYGDVMLLSLNVQLFDVGKKCGW